MRFSIKGAVVFLLFSAAAFPAVPDRVTRPIDPTRLRAIPGSVHHLARNAQFDRGPADPNLPLDHIVLFIRPTAAQQSSLDRLLADQQNPSSPNYRNWLTPQAYADRFGLSPSDQAKIAAWLKAEGLTVQESGQGRNWISFAGPADRVSKALHTSIHAYEIDGAARFGNATDPQVPEAIADLVAGFAGLNNFKPKPRAHILASTATVSNYLTPSAFSTIYDLKPLYAAGIDGSGQNIAVVGESDIALSDIRGFRNVFGLPAMDPKTLLYGADPGFNGAQAEANLDIEWSGAIAQKATIYYVYGQDAFIAWTFAVSANIAPVISISFGGCEADSPAAAYRTIAQQGNAQGITTLSASGDSGGGGCDSQGEQPVATFGSSAAFPAVIPEVTGVGGTMFNEGSGTYWKTVTTASASSALSYIPETVWNESSLAEGIGASGGGVSRIFAKPGWQNGLGVPADGARDVPDLALSAAFHDAYLITYNSGTGVIPIAGTSAASPSMAGIVALINQYQVKQGYQKAAGLANINPQLYRLAQAAPAAFHDIVSGSNQVPCELGTMDCLNGTVGYNAGPGYDLATGLGSVDANVLVTSWHTATWTPTVTVTATPAKPTVNDTVTVTVTVTGTTGIPTGSVDFAAYSLPLGSAALTASGKSATATFSFGAWRLNGLGANTIYAAYSGDAAFSSAAGSARVQVTQPTAPNTSAILVNYPSRVYAIQSGTEPPTWQFAISLGDIAGVPSLITGFTIDGQPQTLSQYFPSTSIPAGGSLQAAFVMRNLAVPVIRVFGFTGTDAGGNQWTRQVSIQFIGAGTEISGFNLWAAPLNILQNTAASASCQWSQQILIDGSGYGQTLVGLFRGSVDVSSSIPAVFGTNRLAPWGSLQGTLCWPGQVAPSTDFLVVETQDDYGDTYSQNVNVTFSGPAATAVQLSASPASISLQPSTIPGFQTGPTLSVNLSDKTQPWTATVYPADETTNWLQLSQYSGVGPATIAVQALPAGFAPGAYKATVLIESPRATPQWVTVPVMWVNAANAQGPRVTSLANSLSFGAGASPGMLMTIYGTGLANATAVSPATLDNSLAGVSVTVNGWPAPLLYVSPTQLNIQVPYETGAGPAVLGINNNGQVGGYLFQVTPSSPGIFNPGGLTAKAGSYATIYLTGVGDVSPSIATGTALPVLAPVGALPRPMLFVDVSLNGSPALVQFAGLIPGPVGVAQINFLVPSTAPVGPMPVVVWVNGVASQTVTLNVTSPVK
jgi:uncharacterized protein (TIGR03437 family)